MRLRRHLGAPIAALAAAASLSGCMVDLYGGDPQLQVQVDSHRWTLESEGLGDTTSPVWMVSFDPPVGGGAVSRVENLPVAGNLNLFLRLADTLGKDTVVPYRLDAGVGDFLKLDLVDDSIGRLLIR
ncbi:MAG TPA: hypothetical protein VN931_07210 [Fibrobacteria bacterium]|nr:hypothetical protein [Fibrobacteria bacterium]